MHGPFFRLNRMKIVIEIILMMSVLAYCAAMTADNITSCTHAIYNLFKYYVKHLLNYGE